MRKIAGWTGRYVLPVLLLLGAFYGSRRLIASRPEAVRQVTRQRVVPVEVVLPVLTNHTVRIEAMGQVVPARRVEIRAQVGGRVDSVHADFEVGGRIKAGAVLAMLEPDDYETALAEAQSGYAQASLSEAVELQRQAIAREELDREGSVLPEGPGRTIALREPQVEAARRSREAAASSVGRARRNLERTRIYSSFDAVVLRKYADLGSVLSPQALVGDIAAVDQFHVEAVLPPSALAWLPPLDTEGRFTGTPAVSIGVSTGADTVWRDAVLSRLLADMSGNMARVLVVVEDPLGAAAVPMLLGSYVRLMIPGRELRDVMAIPRRAVREDGTVLLADGGDQLVVRDLEIVWQTPELTFLRSGLDTGDRVIATALAAAVPGMSLAVMVAEAEEP